MKIVKVLLVIALVGGLALGIGFSGPAAGRDFRIGVLGISPYPYYLAIEDPYWRIVGWGAMYANDFFPDVEVTFDVTSPDEQYDVIEEWINMGFDGIAVASFDWSDLIFEIYEVREGYDRLLFYIRANMALAGELAGRKMCRLMEARGLQDEGAQVVILAGSPEDYPSVMRVDAFRWTLCPWVKVADILYDHGDWDAAWANAMSTLEHYPELDGIYAADALSGKAAAQVLQLMHKDEDIDLICFETFGEHLAFLKEGVIDATITQRSYLLGFWAVEALYRYLHIKEHGGWRPPSDGLYLPTLLVTKENVEQFEHIVSGELPLPLPPGSISYLPYLVDKKVIMEGYLEEPGASYLVSDPERLEENSKILEGEYLTILTDRYTDWYRGSYIWVRGLLEPYEDQYPDYVARAEGVLRVEEWVDLEEEFIYKPLWELDPPQEGLDHQKGLPSYPELPKTTYASSTGSTSKHKIPTGCAYVVYISGAPYSPPTGGRYDNYDRYWNDLVFTYKTFKKLGVPDDHIYILYSSGKGKEKVDGKEVVDYSATKANLKAVFADIASRTKDLAAARGVCPSCTLYIITSNHGSGYNPDDGVRIKAPITQWEANNDGRVDGSQNDPQDEPWGEYSESATGQDVNGDRDTADVFSFDEGLVLYGEILTDDELTGIIEHFLEELAWKVAIFEILAEMEQCFSGGFIPEFKHITGYYLTKGEIATATSEEKLSYSKNNYDAFHYHFISALNGATPDGTAVDADFDDDGQVSWKEAFEYAKAKDTTDDKPQYFVWPP